MFLARMCELFCHSVNQPGVVLKKTLNFWASRTFGFGGPNLPGDEVGLRVCDICWWLCFVSLLFAYN